MHSLAKKHLWPEHLTSLPKMGVGTLSSVSAFDRERAPMYAYGITLEILDEQWSHLRTLEAQILMSHSTMNDSMVV